MYSKGFCMEKLILINNLLMIVLFDPKISWSISNATLQKIVF